VGEGEGVRRRGEVVDVGGRGGGGVGGGGGTPSSSTAYALPGTRSSVLEYKLSLDCSCHLMY